MWTTEKYMFAKFGNHEDMVISNSIYSKMAINHFAISVETLFVSNYSKLY